VPAQGITSVQGPWRRVIDTARAGKPDPDVLRDLVDGILTPWGAVVSRPGSQALSPMLGTGEAQGLAGLELAGTLYTVGVRGGLLQTYDWTADAWTAVPHTGTTINVTGPVWLGGFFDQLVVSDGVNTPWRTTMGSGTGAYIPVSGPIFGPMPVKDAKLFAVLAGDRRTLVWSEEADLAIGWDTAGYNNAWDLRQTAQGALVAIRASNTALVYQREQSTGQILGSVNDEFQASGTLDDVAARGTLSPFGSVLTADGRLWSVDALGRPYRAAAGVATDDLWLAASATVEDVDRDRLYVAWAAEVPDLDVIAFALPRTAGNLRNTDLVCFDRATGDYVGRQRIGADPAGDLAWGALCADDAGVSRLVVLDHTGRPTVLWRVAEADADPVKALDVTATASAVVPTRVVTAEASVEGADQAAAVQWTGAVLETGRPHAGIPPTLALSTGTSLTYSCETPGHPFGSHDRDGTVITVGPNGRKEIGWQRWGRWLRAAFAPASGDTEGSERFRLWRVTVLGRLRDAAARRR
jgi:hypothetical protein